MLNDLPITVLDDSLAEKGAANHTEIIGLTLDIAGQSLDFHIAAAGEARLADIVPAARAISGKITDTILEQTHLSGVSIPCCKGCSACCNYLVSLSIPEILCFKQEIFPKSKYSPDSALRTYLLAARQLISRRPPKNHSDLNALSNWYASLNLTCPFLANRQCSIYHQRPLGCREHFVTGAASGCRKKSAKAEIVDIPIRMGNILCQLTKKLCAADDTAMLPLALAWYEENKQLDERRWPAAMIANLFAEITEETVSTLVGM